MQKNIYNPFKNPSKFIYNEQTRKFDFVKNTADIRVVLECKDLRYMGFGVKKTYYVCINFPDHSIDKNFRRNGFVDEDRVEIWINKMLKKNGYKQINFNTELVRSADIEYTINNIGRE
jgi:hypothetical protein